MNDTACAAVGTAHLLQRLCDGVRIDERIYFAARTRFERRVQRSPSHATRRSVRRLHAANDALAQRAEAQAALPLHALERASGVTLQSEYTIVLGMLSRIGDAPSLRPHASHSRLCPMPLLRGLSPLPTRAAKPGAQAAPHPA